MSNTKKCNHCGSSNITFMLSTDARQNPETGEWELNLDGSLKDNIENIVDPNRGQCNECSTHLYWGNLK